MNTTTGAGYSRKKVMSDVGSAFDEMLLSSEDKEQARQIRGKISSGELSAAEGHTQMEALRARYHYSGGTDGSKYIPLTQKTAEYASRYDALKQDKTNKMLKRKPFSYDAESDPLYRQYRKEYLADGKQAMDDTVAIVAAQTGGMASSYAAKAGQDAYNAYAEKAEDKIPELEQLAYQRYLREGEEQMDAIELLRKLDAEDYSRWNDRQNAIRSEDKQMREIALSYQKDEEGEEQEAKKTAREDVQSHLSSGGDWRDLPQSLLEASGYSEKQLEQMKTDIRNSSAAAAKTALQQTIYKTGYRPTDEELAGAGMTRAEADQWAAAYKSGLKTSGSSKSNGKTAANSSDFNEVAKRVMTFNTMRAAVKYLKNVRDEGVLTAEECKRIATIHLGVKLDD